jgi:type II secretory pathway pseudopilin PulG
MKNITRKFTMLELIVSMSVLTVIMIIMMEFFSSAQKAWVASSEQADVYDNARIALDLITSDLNSISYKPTSNINFYHSGTMPDILGFIAYSNGGLKKIIYTVNKNQSPGNKKYRFLVRCAVTDHDYSTKPAGTESTVFNVPEKEYSRIIPHVCDLEFTCYDKDLNKIDPGSKYGQFPWYVQIKLTLMGSRNFEKWKAFKNVSATKADELLESYGVTINKLVYLVNRGQP